MTLFLQVYGVLAIHTCSGPKIQYANEVRTKMDDAMWLCELEELEYIFCRFTLT